MKSFFVKYKFHLILFLLAFVLYGNTLDHSYAWDDAIVITGNERVQKGIEGVPELFQNYKSNEVSDIYGYRPITLLTFAIEVELFGLNPKVSHFTNVLLYGLLLVLIFNFLIQFFGKEQLWFCFIVCLIYLVHPVHTEVVANIKSRDEILAFIFGILAMKYFLKSLNSDKKWISLLQCFSMLVLAFLSKESALAFIPLLGLILLFNLAFSIKKILSYAFVLIVFIASLVGLWRFSQSDLVLNDQTSELIEKGQYLNNGFLSNPLVEVNDFNQIMVEGISLLAKYVQLFVVPHPLLHDYGFNQIPKVEGANFTLVLSFFTLLAFLIYLVLTRKEKSPFKFGVLFFLAGIFGYLNILQAGKDQFAERFLFVPSLGLSIAIVSLSFLLIKKIRKKNTKPQSALVIWLPVLLIFSGLTIHRNKAWANNEALFSTDLPRLKNCVRANFNYASYLDSKISNYSNPQNSEKLKKVIYHYQRCIQISNRSYKAYVNLGKIYMALGEWDKALPLFNELSLNYPQLSEPHFLLGKYYLSTENYTAALKAFQKSKHNGWAKTENYYHIALAYIKMGQLENSIHILEEGLVYEPDYYQYFDVLADLYLINQDSSKAAFYSKKALVIDPNNSMLNAKFNERGTWLN